MAKPWEDNFSKLVESNLQVAENKEWRFSVEEHTTKGTMQINFREFKSSTVEGGYNGPTKNGFIFRIQTKEDYDNFKESVFNFLNKVEEFL